MKKAVVLFAAFLALVYLGCKDQEKETQAMVQELQQLYDKNPELVESFLEEVLQFDQVNIRRLGNGKKIRIRLKNRIGFGGKPERILEIILPLPPVKEELQEPEIKPRPVLLPQPKAVAIFYKICLLKQ